MYYVDLLCDFQMYFKYFLKMEMNLVMLSLTVQDAIKNKWIRSV